MYVCRVRCDDWVFYQKYIPRIMQWMHGDPDQDKVLMEDEWMNDSQMAKDYAVS